MTTRSLTIWLCAICYFSAFNLSNAENPTTAPATQPTAAEQWNIFEISLPGPADGNPFVDVALSAHFVSTTQYIDVAGFYDGDGIYRIRFQPNSQGNWKYITHSNRPELDGKAGDFVCAAPSAGNHGPVVVRNTFHFTYADGSTFTPIGTTSHYWAMQTDALADQTLATLKDSPFNKVRMFVMPADEGNVVPLFPFVSTAPRKWDYTRFDPKFFQGIERRVSQLRDLGIQADLILFNPNEHFGYTYMGSSNDDRYLRYVVARFAAYRNVWWSLATDFDLIKNKTDADWDRYFRIVDESDPYHHLRSIQNSLRLYDYTKPWVTHVSLQNSSAVEDFGRADLYRDPYNKPIVFDNVNFEGNQPQRNARLTPQEMTARFWQAAIAGTYAGHGEAITDPSGILWSTRGGTLRGQSPPRIAFLKKILDTAPPDGIDPIDKWQDPRTAGQPASYYLIYLGNDKPDSWLFDLPSIGLKNGMKFHVDMLDTWAMTITPVDDEFTINIDSKYRAHAKGKLKVKLPGEPYMALRIVRIGDAKQ